LTITPTFPAYKTFSKGGLPSLKTPILIFRKELVHHYWAWFPEATWNLRTWCGNTTTTYFVRFGQLVFSPLSLVTKVPEKFIRAECFCWFQPVVRFDERTFFKRYGSQFKKAAPFSVLGRKIDNVFWRRLLTNLNDNNQLRGMVECTSIVLENAITKTSAKFCFKQLCKQNGF